MKVDLRYENFLSPLSLSQPQRNSDTLYVADQIGIIYSISKETVGIFLDIRDKIGKLREEYDEQGLLDFAFHPNYPKDNRIFIFYSTKISDTKSINYLSEITIRDDKGIGNNYKEIPVLRIEKKTDYHNGGRLAFGPDNYLYLTVGDAGKQADPNNHGQRIDVLFGKILRLDISTPGRYKVPLDNPFINVPKAQPLIYAFGLRNPWSISFDSYGNMFSADVGYETTEEINIIIKSGNYGWRIKEGSSRTPFGSPSDNITQTPLIDPIFEYTHDQIRQTNLKNKKMIAIVGGYSLSDSSYVFGDLAGLILRIKPNQYGKWELIDSLIIDEFIKAFGKDNSGNIYVMTSDKVGPHGNGKIYQIQF